MNLKGSISKTQRFIFLLLVCSIAVLGYLLYNSHSENIRVQKLLSEAMEDNLDLSQDIEIVKQKYDNLERRLSQSNKQVAKVSYKKPYKKRVLSAAGKSSKKSAYKKGKVNYKKLYFELKKQCKVKQKKSSKPSTVSNYNRPRYR